MSAAPVWIVGSPAFVERTVERDWAAAGFEPVALPWCERRPPADAGAPAGALASGDFDLIMLTSANALADLPEDAGRGLQAACIGATTAAAARARAFEVVVEIGGAETRAGGRALAEAIAAREPRPAAVLWLCARDRRADARDTLRAGGIEVAEVEAYAMEARADFAATIASAPEPVGVVLGSPRGAEALGVALVGAHRALGVDVRVVVPVGPSTEGAARDAFGERVTVAPPLDGTRGADYIGAVAGRSA